MSARYSRSHLRLAVIGVITILTLVVWSGSKIYQNYTEREPLPELEPVLRDLDPTLNLNALETAEEREYFPINLEDFKLKNIKP